MISLLHETDGEPVRFVSSEWCRAKKALRAGWRVSEGASGDNHRRLSVHAQRAAVISTDGTKPKLRICVGPIDRVQFGVRHPNRSSSRLIRPVSRETGENDAKSWNDTPSEDIIESTDRRCDQNNIVRDADGGDRLGTPG